MSLNRRRVVTGVAVYSAFFLAIGGIASAYIAGSAMLILVGYVLLLALPLSALALCYAVFGPDAVRREGEGGGPGCRNAIRRMSVRTAMLLSAVLGGFLLVCVMLLSALRPGVPAGWAVVACLAIAWGCPFALWATQGNWREKG